MPKILLIDDDPTFCLMLSTFLKRQQYEVKTAFTANEGLQQLKAGTFDLVLTDFRLPDKNGLELLEQIRVLTTEVPVILMTHYADIRTAVRAIKMGAFEYLAKPINPDETLLTIRKALSRNAKGVESEAAIPMRNRFSFVKGASPQSLQLEEYIALIAPTNMSVIIEGESGTGKEYVARKIHQSSKRHNKPFVAIDCGALSKELAGSELFGHVKGSFTGAMADKEGQFEAANGGTLFLDEIGNLSYEIQVKLLRAIQERKVRKIGSNTDLDVDVRIIAATNEDLVQAVSQGEFREDLYHRLNEFKINISPLRDRQADILIFADYFLEVANHELERDVNGFDAAVTVAMERYSWPGNLRELKNVVKRAVLLAKGNEITLDDLPPEIAYHIPMPTNIVTPPDATRVAPVTDLRSATERSEKELILDMLERVKYNKSKAARLLNIDRKTLYNKMRQYNIDA
ncbi:sigma-54-dependent Fis family transcriptional regulator [Pontibacter sp. JH31]|uniref:Sigma-54-dependent Fis family transcriptional regulator n=1 Tax=Pontibacter aquaedesilientis TaxID=2766980 RepID=A0ABR7XG59_9BACT|nr:sigma-54 dependent transcriptional regulator [Pontibacter aquaedesilientis]MBD1397289.1 sigma-54-dependent Fis family transcriptional regulator [Pontibacter aquaedesilientis]